MTTTNNISTSNNTSSNVVAKIFVKKVGKRQFKAGVKFAGQWVIGEGQQTRTAIKAAEEALAKLGAPKATWNIVKVEAPEVSAKESPKVEATEISTSAKVEAAPKANSAKAFKLDSCYAWAVASSTAVALQLGKSPSADKDLIKAERIIAYKMAYVAASRAAFKGSVQAKVAKFEKDLAAAGREVMFLDGVRENIINSGYVIAK
jgi:hypothetical protein